jgi:hypothetical protein
MLEIRRATIDELIEIWRIVHDSYAWRGYIQHKRDRIFKHFEYLENIPETTQLVALVDSVIIGTVSFTFDNSLGLPSDVDYHEETDKLRLSGYDLVGFWRFAVSANDELKDKYRISHTLITESIKVCIESGGQTALIECHPRHAKYYSRRLGFEVIAERSETTGLSNAPSVLMVGRKERYSRHI